jgi:transcriptional regulator GlxA family with amidase domain
MRERTSGLLRSSAPSIEDYRPGFMELLVSDTADVGRSKTKLRFSITAMPRFTLLAFSAFVDAIRIASDVGDRSEPRHCSWTLVGANTHPVTASCGAAISHWESFGDPARFDYVVVVGGLLRDEGCDPRLLAYLRQAAAKGVKIIGICTGVFAMAEAGVLAGHRCCVHGYHLADFRARFPRLQSVSDQIFLIDGDRITCAGGVAAIDLVGCLLERDCGLSRSRKILPHLLVDELRPAEHSQLLLVDDYFTVYDERVRAAVFLMQEHIANPIPVATIARHVGVPVRQLERGFQRSFLMSPSCFFRLMRLRRARWLVLHSSLSITQISIDCGFADTAHLTRSFKREYGHLPSGLRRTAVEAA